MNERTSKKLQQNSPSMTDNEKRGPQKIKVVLRRILNRNLKRKVTRKRRKLTGMKKKRFWKSTSVKNIH